MLMRAETDCLILVDLQARLVPAMAAPEGALGRARLLIAAARETGVPVLVTEHCPASLGATVAEIARPAAEAGARVVEKTRFSAAAEPAFAEAMAALGRRRAVVAGMEAHICVAQTALGLLEAGCEVFVVADAVAARDPANTEAALARLRAAGAGIVTAEMAVFEWLGRADTPAFKALLPLVK